MKLLVVDSETEVCEILYDFFSEKGLLVVTAPNGRDAYKIVQTEKIDVIISEVRMPGGGGVELLHQIKNNGEITSLFWFMNARPDMSKEDAISLGAEGIFHKPFELSVALDEILKIAELKEFGKSGNCIRSE